ncbi:hypothetical protein [Methylorubrum suomiense]|uniref:Uncharacterized protein n=1 Tax=Methylorubrum suomiense TaxID=144191 RepID=A0ABQ4V0T6_9HYPH|nr:hypothetical protein [Methylorubrum suomiense]GJE77244.1 hypothetical protein BGCPKDLD_3847 [Methylorubrum suomiense]
MADFLKTYGTIGGFTLTQRSRPFVPADYGNFPFTVPTSPFPTIVYVLTVTKGATVTDVALEPANDVFTLNGSPALDRRAQIILTTFAAIGAQVALGDPTTPIIANPNGSGAYVRIVDLVPGTPVPPGSGVRISGSTDPFKLKLANGGVIELTRDAADSAGSIFNGLAVVDAVTPLPTGGKVQILY